MRFMIETSMLNSGIATASKALPSKTPVSILEGIYLCAMDKGLLVRCSDMMLQIDVIVPATVEEYGEVVVPRQFAEMARRLPGETIDIELKENTLHYKSGGVENEIQCMDAEDYPLMPVIQKKQDIIVTQKQLKDMIRQTVFATAQEESKPILTGVLVQVVNNELRLVALDGFRLALRRQPLNMPTEEIEAVIPARSLLEISRVLADDDTPVEILIAGVHVTLKIGEMSIIARLLEGDYIKYEQILPTEHETRVLVDRRDLLNSIERAIVVSRDGRSNLVKFSFKKNVLYLTANSSISNLREQMDVQINGPDIDIAFNARYFSDVFRALDDDYVYLEMRNNVSPCVVRPVQGDAFYYLILPVRLFT